MTYKHKKNAQTFTDIYPLYSLYIKFFHEAKYSFGYNQNIVLQTELDLLNRKHIL